MINLKDQLLHQLNPIKYPSKANAATNKPIASANPSTPNSGHREDQQHAVDAINLYLLKDTSKKMKYFLSCLKSQDPKQRKLAFAIFALLINGMEKCMSKELLTLIKSCYHEDYLFFNLMSKNSLIRKKDLDIFKPTNNKNKVVVMNSMPLI
jgi:hypothetical protein